MPPAEGGGMEINMRKKTLPVQNPNEFFAYKPFDASRIAILLTQNPICKELYENFIHYRIEKINIQGHTELDCHFNEEFSSIGVKKMPIDFLLNFSIDFIEFCKMSIDRNFYLFIPIECSEISNYSVYKKEKLPHHIFVYGYDDDQQVFLCSEFFSFSKKRYSFESVSYLEMKMAFLGLQSQTTPDMMNKEKFQWLKEIQLLHSFVDYKDKFTIQRIQSGLRFYLDERDCCGNKGYLKDVYYGIAIYDLLEEYIIEIIKKDYELFDIRCFTLIFFHFRYLRLQAEFIKQNYNFNMEKQNEYINKFLELEKYANILLNIAIKYQITRDKAILQHIIKKLKKLKEGDIDILTQYIKYLAIIECAPSNGYNV